MIYSSAFKRPYDSNVEESKNFLVKRKTDLAVQTVSKIRFPLSKKEVSIKKKKKKRNENFRQTRQ